LTKTFLKIGCIKEVCSDNVDSEAYSFIVPSNNKNSAFESLFYEINTSNGTIVCNEKRTLMLVNGSEIKITDLKINDVIIQGIVTSINIIKMHSKNIVKKIKKDNILGWCYEQVSDEFAKDNMETEYIVEGFSPELNIRNCIIPPENKIIMSIDYESQEAKLLALLSQDSVMIKNFLDGIDPHTATAHGIWGKENYNKEIRKLAKMVNFLVNYGGGYGTLSNNAEIPLDEAKEILSKYEATFWECMEWKKRQVSKMYRNAGTVYTMFGRPRRLSSYIKVAEKNREEYDSLEMSRKCDGFIRAAERRVASHEIQGLAGDLCRYVLIKLYDKYFKLLNEDVAFMNVVHDEVNFYITKDHDTIIKYARELEELMKFEKQGWQFPISTSIDLGNRWGSTIPYYWNKDKTTLLPKRVH